MPNGLNAIVKNALSAATIASRHAAKSLEISRVSGPNAGIIASYAAGNVAKNVAPNDAMTAALNSAKKDGRNAATIAAPNNVKNDARRDGLNVGTTAASSNVRIDGLSAGRTVASSNARIGAPNDAMIAASSSAKIDGLSGVRTGASKIGGKTARSAAIRMIAVTIKVIAMRAAIIVTVTIAIMIGTIATTGILTGIIAATIMAITIAIIIVGIISGTIHRVRFTGAGTVHSTITRGQPSDLCMIATMCRAITLADITAITPTRSSSVIIIIGASMTRRMAIIGSMIMTVETPFWPPSQPGQLLAS